MIIDCREAVRRMWSYLDRALASEPLTEFEAHLDTCVRCCGELEFTRHLRGLVATSESMPSMPPDLRMRVEQLLLLDADAEERSRS